METPQEENSTLSFKYLKAPDCKTFFVEGTTGGLTPRGNLYLHLYQERGPTPDIVTHRLTEDGRLGDVERVEVHDGIIREVQCGLVLEPLAAAQLFAWLGDHLQELQRLQNESEHPTEDADTSALAPEDS